MAGNTAPEIKPASSPAQRALQLVELSNVAMEKAAAFEETVQQKQAAANAKIASVCDALIANERVRPDQREKLAEALRDHANTLDLLQGLAAHRTPAEASSLGQGRAGTVTKTAGVQNVDRPFAGTLAKKQASANLFSKLGLPVPADV
jgi:hypothetical protein